MYSLQQLFHRSARPSGLLPPPGVALESGGEKAGPGSTPGNADRIESGPAPPGGERSASMAEGDSPRRAARLEPIENRR